VVAFLVYILFLETLYLVLQLNYHETFSITDPEVARQKHEERLICEAKAHPQGFKFKNGTFGRQLEKEFWKDDRQTYEVLYWTTQAIFRLGSMYAIAPAFALAVIALPFKKKTTIFPFSLLAVYSPLLYSVTAGCLVSFTYYHLFLDNLKGSLCVNISGHWFTYVISTLLMLLSTLHFIYRGRLSIKTVLYVLYFGAHQAASLAALWSTQKFYHDSQEAHAGVMQAIYISPLVFVMFCAVELIERRRFRWQQVNF
jgi:hypothetical protein